MCSDGCVMKFHTFCLETSFTQLLSEWCNTKFWVAAELAITNKMPGWATHARTYYTGVYCNETSSCQLGTTYVKNLQFQLFSFSSGEAQKIEINLIWCQSLIGINSSQAFVSQPNLTQLTTSWATPKSCPSRLKPSFNCACRVTGAYFILLHSPCLSLVTPGCAKNSFYDVIRHRRPGEEEITGSAMRIVRQLLNYEISDVSRRPNWPKTNKSGR